MKVKIYSIIGLLLLTFGAWGQNDVTTDATMSEGWTISPANPVTVGATVTATYNGSRHVKSVKWKQVNPINLGSLSGDYTLQDGDVATGTLSGNYKVSIADGATVTLSNVTINGTNSYSYTWAGLTCLGDATIDLFGTNVIKGFENARPGIFVPDNKTLTIQGSGSLTSSSNGYGAGIGGGNEIACGNIVIKSGTITANGGVNCAGIGAGSQATCGTITILGGTITATGGEYGAGIGSAYTDTEGPQSTCGNITISGGVVTATGGAECAAIGSGRRSACGTVTIGGGASVQGTKGTDAPYSIGSGVGGTCGTVTVYGTGNPDGISTSPVNCFSLSNVTANCTLQNGDWVGGTLLGNYKVSIADGATVTLNGITINGIDDNNYDWAGLTCAGDATIILSGTNKVKGFHSLFPGIYVPKNKTLTIQGTGSLTASCSSYGTGAGIGGGANNIDCGNIVIESGTITANGGQYAAGIGSGFSASCGTITVGGIELDNIATNPYVYPINLSTLKGDYEAQHGDRLTGTLDRTVSISIAAGATVTLDGITISGSDLINSNQWPGLNCKGDAVIILKEGSTNSVRGYYPTCSSVYVPQGNLLTIRGEGTLRAFGSVHAPGIGSSTTTHPSFKTWHCGTIRIESGTIEALGGWEAPGIGCNGGTGIGSAAGGYGFAGTIHISGGIVTATGGAGNAEPKSKDEYYGAGAGIGSGGSDSSCGTITITNTITRVTATSGSVGGAQSIGKGADGSTCGTVTIHTTVYADGINTAPFIYPAIP